MQLTRAPQRTAADIAQELVTQANSPQSALRLLRPDLRGGSRVTGDGAPAARVRSVSELAGGDVDEGDADDEAAVDTLGMPRGGAGDLPTLSASMAARGGTFAGGYGVGIGDDDQDDDEIPLDLPHEGGDGGGDRLPNGDASGDDDVVDPVETVRVQLTEMLGDEFLPETRVCCAVTHEKFTVASITGTSIPSPPDSDNDGGTDEEGDADEEEQGKAERRRARQGKREKFEARRRQLQKPADRPGEFEVVPPWGLVISPLGKDLLRANDVVGLYAIDVEVMEEPPMTWTRLVSATGQARSSERTHAHTRTPKHDTSPQFIRSKAGGCGYRARLGPRPRTAVCVGPDLGHGRGYRARYTHGRARPWVSAVG